MDAAEHPDGDLEYEPDNEEDIFLSYLHGTLDDYVSEENTQVHDDNSYDEDDAKLFFMTSQW